LFDTTVERERQLLDLELDQHGFVGFQMSKST
jgi:hypothetical protein